MPGIGADDKVILWGGGIYNWFDPLTLIRAVDRLRERRPDVRLFFLGLQAPQPRRARDAHGRGDARQLSDELGLTDKHVFFNEGWVAYDDRQNYLLEADIGVSTHLDHVETAFSLPHPHPRLPVGALPIVATGGDTFGDLIESTGLGITVPPERRRRRWTRRSSCSTTRTAIAAARARVAGGRRRAPWTRVLAPLVEFCRAPRRAADLALRATGDARPTRSGCPRRRPSRSAATCACSAST